jgi:hypothetical protein
MAAAVYALCALTSLACAALLVRGVLQSRQGLLAWCCAGFVGLAANNVVLLLDRVVLPGVDLSLWRLVPAAAGMVLMVLGLILSED